MLPQEAAQRHSGCTALRVVAIEGAVSEHFIIRLMAENIEELVHDALHLFCSHRLLQGQQ
jgi:hypothetical protein